MAIGLEASKPSLVLQTVWFHEQDREPARKLGEELYGLLTRPPDDPLAAGAGIPVGVGVSADRVDTEVAACLVLVPVLGAAAFQQRRAAAIEHLRSWHDALGSGHVVALQTTPAWRAADGRLPGITVPEHGRDADHRRSLDEIVLAIARLLAPDSRSVPLFVSYARADVEATEEAAKKIHDHVVTGGTGRAFFDRIGGQPGHDLAPQLDRAAGRGVFVAVRSDSYSSRVWCQRELLVAKREGVPTLTVELLDHGEPRSLPYGGNGPSMVWRGDPAAVASRAVIEWLRAEHFRREARRIVALAGLPDGVTVLARPPELLDIAQGPVSSDRAQLVFHPDPELPVLEAQVLVRAHPRLRLATPTTAYRRLLGRGERWHGMPLEKLQVGLSVSASPDLDGAEGTTTEHLRDAIVFLARSLVSAGAALGYGGDFRPKGFTPLLAELIVAYNQTVQNREKLLHGYVAAHLDRDQAGDLEISMHHLADAEDVGAEALSRLPGEPEPPSALSFSDMRRVMIGHLDAVIALGGQAEPRRQPGGRGYGGRYPGVVEEAWRTLEADKPLYVLGGFAGAAGLVARLLDDEQTPPRLREATWAGVEAYEEVSRLVDDHPHRRRLGLPRTPDELAAEVRAHGRRVLSSDETARRWNGLTVAENRLLFATRDLATLTALVLNGLLRWSRARSPGALEIELVQGDVSQARDLDVLAVACFDDAPLGASAAAVDRALGGAASRQRREKDRLTPIAFGPIGADWLYVASLGPVGDLAALDQRVEDAARATAEEAERLGIERLGVVAFGGSVVGDLDRVAAAMLRGLTGLAGRTAVSWFESDDERYDRLRTALEERPEEIRLTTRESVPAVQPPLERVELFLTVRYSEEHLFSTLVAPSAVGVAPSRNPPLTQKALEALGAGVGPAGKDTPDLATLAGRGAELARLLLGTGASEVLARYADSKLVVAHDEATSRLPFEALSGAGSPEAPSVRGGVTRRLTALVPPESAIPRPGMRPPLRMLLVVDPTEDMSGARTEGEAVIATVDNINADARNRGSAEAIALHVLRGAEATVDALRRSLRRIELLHFCGHGAFDETVPGRSGLILAGPEFLTAERLAGMEVPRVAFFNSCEVGRVRGEPPPQVAETASFAEYFLLAGVEAYLGTLWRVGDAAATRFAHVVYSRLAMGQTLDAAVTAARRKLLEDGSPDWANYVLYGDGRFRLVAGR